jgi:hypothetical protein
MAKFVGLLTSMTFGGSSDFANDVTQMQIGSPTNMVDVSGLDVDGFERLAGRKDTQISITGVVSDDASGFHATFSGASSEQVSGSLVIVFEAGVTATVSVIANGYNVQVNNDLGMVATTTLQMFDGTPLVWS